MTTRANNLRTYGLTQEMYDWLLARQNGRCAICLGDDTKSRHGVLHVDHCHQTGRIRGLLCSTCNTALGKFNDDLKVLERAIAYLKDKSASEELKSTNFRPPKPKMVRHSSEACSHVLDMSKARTIRALRTIRNWSQAKIANHLGISQGMVSRVLLDKSWTESDSKGLLF